MLTLALFIDTTHFLIQKGAYHTSQYKEAQTLLFFQIFLTTFGKDTAKTNKKKQERALSVPASLNIILA